VWTNGHAIVTIKFYSQNQVGGWIGPEGQSLPTSEKQFKVEVFPVQLRDLIFFVYFSHCSDLQIWLGKMSTYLVCIKWCHHFSHFYKRSEFVSAIHRLKSSCGVFEG
jgi:hypothetical protein